MTAHAPSKKVMRAGILIFVTIGLRAVVNVLLVRLGISTLGEQKYGLWVLIQSLVAYLNLADLGIGQSIMNAQGANAERRDWNQASGVVSAGVAIYGAIALGVIALMTLALFALAPSLWHSEFLALNDFQMWMLILAPLSLAVLPLSAFSASLAGLRDLDIRYVWEIGLVVVMTTATATAMIWTGSVFLTLMAPLLAQFLWYWIPPFLLRKRHPDVRFRLTAIQKDTAHRLLGSSLFIFLISLAVITQRYAANFITSSLISLEAVAKVQPHFLIFQVFGWSLTDAITKAMLPYLTGMGVRGDWERIRFIAQLSAKTTILVATLFGAAMWSAGEPLMTLWLGPGAYLGDTALLLLIGIFIMDSSSMVFTNLSLALERHRARAIAIALYAFFWASGGAIGAWLAPVEFKVIGMLCGAISVSFLFQAIVFPLLNRLDVGFNLTRHFKRVLLPSFLTALLIFASVWLSRAIAHQLNLGSWLQAALGFVFIAVTAAIVAHFILFQAEERKWVLARVLPKWLRRS